MVRRHDPEKKMWSKIKLYVSLKYKRVDLSDVLPALLENSVVHEVPGIKRAITYTNREGLLTLKTEGNVNETIFLRAPVNINL